MKSIVSFDLDMTLLDHRSWTIPESALRAIEKLRENHLLVIATGRDMDHTFSSDFRDLLNPDAMIHLNGTKVTVGKQLIFEHFFDKKLLKCLLSFTEKNGYSIGVTLGEVDYYMHPEVVIAHDKEVWGCSRRNFGDPWELMNQDVRTLSFLGNETGAKEIEANFPELKLPLFAAKKGADVVETGISKADGLKRVCEYYGIPLSQTVAFGDSMNDFEIIQAAGLGVAMGNAIEELKVAADYVTSDIDCDGIWNACCHLNLIEK